MPTKWIKYLPHLVAVLLAAAALRSAYRAGFQTAFAAQQAVIEQAEKDKTAALLASADAYAAELARASQLRERQAEQTQQAGIRLAEAAAEIGRLKNERKKGIDHAIKQDHNLHGGCIDGLGTHGLREYRQALGYAD